MPLRSCAHARLALLSAAYFFTVAPLARAQTLPPRSELESLAVATIPRAPAGGPDRALDRALAARDWPHAERLLVAAIERQPRSTALLKTLASVFLMDRRPLNAAIALKKAEAIEPLDPQARFQLVLAYVAMARGEWARPELERLAAAQPASALYPYWLGRLDYDAGQYASAIRRFEAAIALDATFVRAFDNLGLCHEALNQPEEAIVRYREAIRLNRLGAEPSPWPLLNLGILLRTRGAADEAEALFREALRIDAGFRARPLSARRSCSRTRGVPTTRCSRSSARPRPIRRTRSRTTRCRESIAASVARSRRTPSCARSRSSERLPRTDHP